MTLRMIQVGLGGMGKLVARQFVLPSKEFTYAGIVDINNEQLIEAAKELHVPKERCYSDYRQAFEELEADVVLVSAISPVHYQICKAALHHNLHVLVEKPFVLNMNEAEELVELAAKKELILMVNQNYRFFQTVRTLKQVMTEEILGEVLFMHASFYIYHNGKEYQRKMDNYMLLEMAVHHIDMMRFLTKGNVQSVLGQTWNFPNSGYRGDPNVNATYEMESGIPIVYVGSLLSRGKSTPWEGIWRVQCENGSIHLDDLGEGYGVYVIDEGKNYQKVSYQQVPSEGIHGILEDLASSIQNNHQPLTSGKDNLNTLAALFATNESSKQDKRVQL